MSTKVEKQPVGCWIMFVLQLMGFVGFIMVFSLLVLFCTNKLGFSDTTSYGISAAFNALAFATSVPASYIAERFLGFRYSALISIFLAIIGLSIMAIATKASLYIGLGIFIVSSGMMIPVFYVLLGRLYDKNDNHREWGFMLSYIGMNAGGFIGATTSGYITEYISYSAAFIVGAIFAALMIPLFLSTKHIFANNKTNHTKYTLSHSHKLMGYLLLIALTVATIVLVYFSAICNSLLLILGVVSVVYMLFVAFQAESAQAKRNIIIFAVLITISVMFWTLYSLAPSALTLFTERNVDRHIFGALIPASDFTSLNSFFIITVGPLLNLFWNKCRNRGVNFSTATKIAIGTLLMGFGYLALTVGINDHNPLGFMAVGWLVLSYFFQTTGELMVGPINYAMVGEFIPQKFEGVMMGISQLATGVGGALSAYFADYTSSAADATKPLLTNPTYGHAFLIFGLLTCAVGVIALGISYYIWKSKHRVHQGA